MSGRAGSGRRVAAVLAVLVGAIATLGAVARWLGPERPLTPEEGLSRAPGEPGLYEVDPDLLWRLKPGLDLASEGVRIRTNALGLRGPEPRDPVVLAVGDGVAFGSRVAEEDSWPRQLERLTGVEVVVAAVPGYSSHQGRILLARMLERFRPRLVVIGFGYEDGRLFPLRDDQAMAGPGRGGDSRIAALGKRLERWRAGRRAGRVRALLAAGESAASLFPPRDADAARQFVAAEEAIRAALEGAPERVPVPAYAANLRAMAELCAARGVKPVFLAPPFARASLEPRFAATLRRAPVAVHRERMHELAREIGVTYAASPILFEGGAESVTRLFATRALTPEERAGLDLLALDGDRLSRIGITPDLRGWTDLTAPSAAGHALLAQILARVVQAGAADASGATR